MRLGRARTKPPAIPVIPLANLALLVWTCVMVSGMYSASRGPALRFASVDRDGSFDDTSAVRVEVLSEQDAKVDGEPVPFPGIAGAVSRRIAERDAAAVILVVSPDASYESMVAAYAALAALPGPPRIAFPHRTRGIWR
jgi:biopolymer transport protein ExbD